MSTTSRPDDGFPLNMTDLFGLEVLEFDPIEAEHENHLAFKGPFHANQPTAPGSGAM